MNSARRALARDDSGKSEEEAKEGGEELGEAGEQVEANHGPEDHRPEDHGPDDVSAEGGGGAGGPRRESWIGLWDNLQSPAQCWAGEHAQALERALS